MKLQNSISKQQRELQSPISNRVRGALWTLELGISLELGAWNLVLSEPRSGRGAACAETSRLAMRDVAPAFSCSRSRSTPTARCHFRAGNCAANERLGR